MKQPRHRLFWRNYLNGLFLIVATTVAVTTITLLVPPESRFHGRSERLVQLVSVELARHLDDPVELQATLDRFAPTLERAAAVYHSDGTLLAASGKAPPPLAQEDLPRIGDRHPLHHGDSWVYASPLNGEDAPYLLLQGAEAGWFPFLLSIATVLLVVALISWRRVRIMAAPLERLMTTARALAAGDLSARSGIDRRDDLGDLSSGLDQMAMRLQERLSSERELFANISHEIRTPLARLRVALELCEDFHEDARQTMGRLQGMSADLAELERLVENVLTSARLDLSGSGPAALPVHPRTVALGLFFNEVAARFSRHHPDRALEQMIPLDLPSALIDHELVNRVCDNLLENAVKYSPPGTVVTLSVDIVGDGIRVVVVDQGMGVQEEDLPHLFEPFFRSDRSRSRRTGGVGLGLTLCKRIIEAHGGKISAQLNQEGGLMFSFELPLSGI